MNTIKQRTFSLVIGCGRLGAGIAGALSDENQDVTVIDVDKTSFRKLPPSYGGLTISGSATDMNVLSEAGIQQADNIIIVTDIDNINICAAQMAKVLFHVNNVVVRVYDKEKAELLNGMDINIICPSVLSETEISHFVTLGGEKNV